MQDNKQECKCAKHTCIHAQKNMHRQANITDTMRGYLVVRIT